MELPKHRAVSIGLIAIYLVLCGFNTLIRIRTFSPDGMNYVNVARNISLGQGISQPTIGYNLPRFEPDDTVPIPFTAQPPLYPLTIALMGWSGVSHADCALLISIAGYAGVLLLAFALAYRLYDLPTAYLSVGLLLFYYPLRFVAMKACSEPEGIVFVLFSLWLMVQQKNRTTTTILAALAGLSAGLAFSTRYLFAPLCLIGLAFFYREAEGDKARVQNIGLYLLGFTGPTAAVCARNLIATGRIAPTPNPSQLGVLGNSVAAFLNLFGSYAVPDFQSLQLTAIGLVVLALCAVSMRRRRLPAVVQKVFFGRRRYILTMWCVVYLAVLIFVRSRVYFDPIMARLLAPAGAPLVILLSAFIVETIGALRASQLMQVAALFPLLAAGRELLVALRTPYGGPHLAIANSERLSWIASHCSPNDLIVGNDASDIPFYFPGRESLSFSPYPYTDYLTYDKVVSYCDRHSSRYRRFYLVVRMDGRSYERRRQDYGPFVADIVAGRGKAYPRVILLQHLRDASVFHIE